MDPSIVKDIAVQVPALFILGGTLSYVFLKVLTIILDKQGRQFEKQADQFAQQAQLIEKLIDAVDSMGQRCALLQTPARKR